MREHLWLIALLSHKHRKRQCLCNLHGFLGDNGSIRFQLQHVPEIKVPSQVNGLHCLALLSTSLFDIISVGIFGFRYHIFLVIYKPSSHWTLASMQRNAIRSGAEAPGSSKAAWKVGKDHSLVCGKSCTLVLRKEVYFTWYINNHQ